MASKHLLLLFLLLALVGCARHVEVDEQPEPINVAALDAAKTTDQIILVGATENSDAILFFYEKENGEWKERFRTKAFVGKNGIGKTMEGDMKTPTGTYHFNRAFGIAQDPGSRIAYTQVDESHYWVGDYHSKYFNQLVSLKEGKKFQKEGSEHIVDYVKAYQYCLSISYNEEGRLNAGSAIFLHCFGDNPYTAGCVSVSEDRMRTLLRVVGPGCAIVINSMDTFRAL